MWIPEAFRRGLHVLKTEGCYHLFKAVYSHLYCDETYFLYMKALDGNSPVLSINLMDGMELILINSTDQYTKLLDSGFDFKNTIFRKRLKTSCKAFCLFENKQLAHVTWIALNNDGKKEIDYLPFKVDFDNGEICSGASYTEPKYRGKGLLSYTYAAIFSYLDEIGITKDIFTINVNNLPSNKALSKFNPSIIGKYRYLKITLWERWVKIEN